MVIVVGVHCSANERGACVATLLYEQKMKEWLHKQQQLAERLRQQQQQQQQPPPPPSQQQQQQ